MGMPFDGRLGAADEGLHPAIGECGCRRTVGDHRAVVEGEHAVGEPRHDFHIVLDEQHRQFPALQCRHDDVHHAKLLLDRNSAGRLVEQENARRAHYRHGDVEELADALRQGRRQGVPIGGNAEQLDGRFGLPDGRGRFQRRQHPREDAGRSRSGCGGAHVLEHRERGRICATWNEREMPSRVIYARGGR